MSKQSIWGRKGKIGLYRVWRKRRRTDIDARSKEEYAANLQQNLTSAERKLWAQLQGHGFESQQIIQGYIPDFVHRQKMLCIEVDGSVHFNKKKRRKDMAREMHLKCGGYKVLRFTNGQVKKNMKGVLEKILGVA